MLSETANDNTLNAYVELVSNQKLDGNPIKAFKTVHGSPGFKQLAVETQDRIKDLYFEDHVRPFALKNGYMSDQLDDIYDKFTHVYPSQGTTSAQQKLAASYNAGQTFGLGVGAGINNYYTPTSPMEKEAQLALETGPHPTAYAAGKMLGDVAASAPPFVAGGLALKGAMAGVGAMGAMAPRMRGVKALTEVPLVHEAMGKLGTLNPKSFWSKVLQTSAGSALATYADMGIDPDDKVMTTALSSILGAGTELGIGGLIKAFNTTPKSAHGKILKAWQRRLKDQLGVEIELDATDLADPRKALTKFSYRLSDELKSLPISGGSRSARAMDELVELGKAFADVLRPVEVGTAAHVAAEERPKALVNAIRRVYDLRKKAAGQLYGKRDAMAAAFKGGTGEVPPTQLMDSLAQILQENPGMVDVFEESGHSALVGRVRALSKGVADYSEELEAEIVRDMPIKEALSLSRDLRSQLFKGESRWVSRGGTKADKHTISRLLKAVEDDIGKWAENNGGEALLAVDRKARKYFANSIGPMVNDKAMRTIIAKEFAPSQFMKQFLDKVPETMERRMRVLPGKTKRLLRHELYNEMYNNAFVGGRAGAGLFSGEQFLANLEKTLGPIGSKTDYIGKKVFTPKEHKLLMGLAKMNVALKHNTNSLIESRMSRLAVTGEVKLAGGVTGSQKLGPAARLALGLSGTGFAFNFLTRTPYGVRLLTSAATLNPKSQAAKVAVETALDLMNRAITTKLTGLTKRGYDQAIEGLESIKDGVAVNVGWPSKGRKEISVDFGRSVTDGGR